MKDKIYVFLKKWYFALIPLVLTGLMLVVKAVRYESADDVFLYEMANSFPTNSHSEHLMFISVLYGYIYKFLYGIIPAVNWFAVSYLLLHILQFSMLYYVIKRHGSRLSFILITVGLEAYLLYRISFTSLSFIGICVAVVWLVDHVKKLNKDSIVHIIMSLIMMFLSLGMRNGDTFIFGLLVFLPLYFFKWIKKETNLSVIAVILAMLVISNYSVNIIQNYYTATIPPETYFSEFQEYRSSATDRGEFNYDKHREVLTAAGVSENDYELYRQYLYTDKTAFSKDKVKAIAERDFHDQYNLNIVELLKKTVSYDKLHNYLYGFALFAVILFIIFKNKRLEIFSSAFFVAVAEAYLFFRRRPVPRVVNPVAILGIILLMYIVLDERECWHLLPALKRMKYRQFQKLVVPIILVAVLASSSFNIYSLKFNESANLENTFAEIENDKEHIYLAGSQTRNYLMDKHLTLLSRDYYQIPIYMVSGDWQVYTYYWYDLMDKLGFSDYTDCSINTLLDDRVYFVTYDNAVKDELVVFYKEHYQLDVSYRIVKSYPENGLIICDFDVVKT